MSEVVLRSAREADFTFTLGELTPEDLRVLGFTGAEGLSELFEFRIDLASETASLDIKSLLGKGCLLEIAGTAGSRCVNGMVRRFERVGEGANLTYYAAEVVPVHWLLTKRFGSRIFQSTNCSDMTVPGIIQKVFADAGLPAGSYSLALQGEYAPREYVVQYRETDWDFVCRLMEHEGIFFYFEHTADGHKMVLGDSAAAHRPNPVGERFPFREPSGFVHDGEYVFGLRDAAEIQIGAVALDDFDFTKPSLELLSEARDNENKGLHYRDYPGAYVVKDDGARYARVRLEEHVCRKRVVHMAATIRGLMPGFKFTLEEHPVEALNREYLVTHIDHRARQPQSAREEADPARGTGHETDIRAIAADVPYRPPRVTPRPVIHGSQTAIVVGPESEEIYTDRYGRVKVQFHWDHEGQYNENSSCFIRVSQAMAGGQYGMLFLPRVGQEVVVDFLEGDPDRPIVTGRIFNGDHLPPYTLPDHKTRSVIKTHSSKEGGGTNEIMLEDLKDSEKILIFAQKDLHLRVTNDSVQNVGNNLHLTVTRDRVEKIEGNHDATIKGAVKQKIEGDLSSTVQGKVSEKVEGTLSLNCVSDVVEQFDANHKHEVAQTYALKGQNIKLEASSGLELKVGGNHIIISSSGIEIKQGGAGVGLSGNTVFIKGSPQVMINTAPAPPGTPVSPVSASLTAPEAPAEPIEADTATPGADTRYSVTPTALEKLTPEIKKGKLAEVEPPPPPPEVQTSWIEIELVDEADRPIAGERYEVTLADGRVVRGSLDAKGLARIERIPPGECQICFPDLDLAAWERI